MSIKYLLMSLLASSLPITLAAPYPGNLRTSVRSPNRANTEKLFKTRQESCPGASTDAPQFITGPYTNFPEISAWVDFNTMFNNNEQSMLDAGSTNNDVGRIAVAIENASMTIGIDPRVILGIIMEESSGYVGAPTSVDADGVSTGGLMQSSGCTGFPNQNNLPQADTSAMVNCGSMHYKTNLENHGNLLATSSILPALREYNSGSVIESDLSNAPGCVGNPFYVSDISQRFLGEVF